MDPYTVLGVDETASQEDIRKAYKKLAMKFHPDRGGDPEKFKEISSAYDQINTEEKRQEYKFGNQQNSNDFDFSFFNDLFKNRTHQRGWGFPNPDVKVRLNITLEEAYSGTEKLITLEHKTLRLRIPAGVEEGTLLTLHNEAPIKDPGYPPGNLFVEISIHMPPEYAVDGKNLYIRAAVNSLDALLGGSITFNHLDKTKLKVKIPQGTNNGTRIRIAGKGMPHPQSSRRGDLFLIVTLTTPKLEEDQLEQIRNILGKSTEE